MMTRAEFSAKYAPLAVKVSAGTGIFPETVLSFAIVESQTQAKDGNYYPGTDLPAKEANNYFGIKKYPQWFGPWIVGGIKKGFLNGQCTGALFWCNVSTPFMFFTVKFLILFISGFRSSLK